MPAGAGGTPALPGAGAAIRLGVAICCLLAHAFAGNATESQPRSAEDELKAFEVADGLQVELVAAEPLVESPCAMAFDERGRLFVAENRGYPIGPAEGQPPVGTIAMLEDTDGDGRMDKRTTFADGLTFPNGVMPWKGGLIVTCAPDVLFLEDTDGDGKADKRTVLLTGFDTTKSTQLRVNKPTLGPDGWIYFAAGLAGGTVTSPEHPEMPPLKMTGDLRWNPRTGEYQNVDGRSQYGMSFDDWGNRFVCMNRIQVQHVVLSSKDLQRNPNLAFSDTVQNCPELIPNLLMHSTGGAARVYPISSNITTADSHVGTFSAACAIMIWRGGALPEQYRGCAISCEPTGNLVHVDRLEPKGVTFAAVPLLGEQKKELLASRDDWTRPVFLESGPDGALYVCDMYRRVIEHPDYLPAEIRKHTNFEGGKELGRIWRIRQNNSARPTDPSDQAPKRREGWSTVEEAIGRLARQAANGRGWEGAYAFRLFCQSPDAEVAPLRTAMADATPEGRVAILNLLSIAGKLELGDLRAALRDPAQGVQRAAFALARQKPEWEKEILAVPTPQLSIPAEFQRALLLPNVVTPADLTRCLSLLQQDGEDRWVQAGVLGACRGSALAMAKLIMDGEWKLPTAFYKQLGRLIGAENPEMLPETLVSDLFTMDPGLFALVTGFAETRKSGALPLFKGEEASDVLIDRATWELDLVGEPESQLPSALAFLASVPWERAQEILFKAAEMRDRLDVFEAAVRALAQFDSPEVTRTLLKKERWSTATPAEREITLSALLARPRHLTGILDAIERNDVPASVIAGIRRSAFEKSKDPAIRERAAKLFASAGGDRQKVFEAAKDCLTLAPNAAHGHELFKATCTTCHRLNQEGSAVGPDLFDIRNQPKESILFHIIIPDAEIAPNFTAYMAETKDGRTLAGLLASETETSVTLRMPLAQEETILRTNLAKLTALPNSLMPTGLDAAMSKQDLADLLAYLKGEQ